MTAARVSVAAIPVLALCALGLARLAEREGSAEAIVRKLVRPELLEDFAARFAAAVRVPAERHARLDPDLHDTPVTRPNERCSTPSTFAWFTTRRATGSWSAPR